MNHEQEQKTQNCKQNFISHEQNLFVITYFLLPEIQPGSKYSFVYEFIMNSDVILKKIRYP
ncbi:MAG TPA: hypothetical protein DCX89_04985 [Saprospirales bacterium]|nr:hypothetical protein [Saprospirales bacterium]